MTKFSLICATYNADETIGHLLKSIKEQIFQNYELIIVDGGSTDYTLQIVNEYSFPNLKVISEKDKGIYDAMNKGIALSTGDWILLIGADDKLSDNNILLNISNISSLNESADAILGKVVMSEQRKKIFVPRFSPKLLFINSIHHQGIFYHRRMFHEFTYNIEYKISADYELNLLMYLKKCHLIYSDLEISVTGEHGISSKTRWQGYKEEILIRNKLIKNPFKTKILNGLTIVRYLLKKYWIMR